MALHGPIRVNSQEVGYWQARRIVTGADGMNTYRCVVNWTPEGERRSGPMNEHSREETFELRHHYDDGALVLAAKVLANAVELAGEIHDG